MKTICVIFISVFLCAKGLSGQPFIEINLGLTGSWGGEVTWGDYDNDGDLDILITGISGNGEPISRVYRNDNGIFIDFEALITSVGYSSSTWGDYDNDGDLDLVTSGLTAYPPSSITRLYKNNENIFINSNCEFPGLSGSTVRWCDFDKNGTLDFLLSGGDINSTGYTKLYKNSGCEIFNEVYAFDGLSNGDATWRDYNNDGFLDLIISGYCTQYTYKTIIYKNNKDGSFTDINAGLFGLAYGMVDLGDYDNDGDWDILLSGQDPAWNEKTLIYKNLGNSIFINVNSVIPDLTATSGEWGDFDNDGDLDILITGNPNNGPKISRVYKNNGNDLFSDINANLVGITGSAQWGDYDNDSDLDILVSGSTLSPEATVLKIYRNDGNYTNQKETLNSKPDPPAGLYSIVTGNTATLFWNKSNDQETPKDGLSYNCHIYITLGKIILTPMSDINTGYRKIPEIGNVQQDTCWFINYLSPGKYYWRVQAIDNGYLGSNFSVVDSFEVKGILVDLKGLLEGPCNDSIMSTSLNENYYLPQDQPYANNPWNYYGNEKLGSFPIAVTDWVLVELRETTGNSSSATSDSIIDKKAALLFSDGKIIGIDGHRPVYFDDEITNNLYAVIYHRNHLSIMSAEPLLSTGAIHAYNFTNGPEKVYGGANGHKQIGSGIWGMVAGDGNADGQVNNSDKAEIWSPQSGTSGYKAGDFNMNGNVDNIDKIEKWKPNTGRASQVPD